MSAVPPKATDKSSGDRTSRRANQKSPTSLNYVVRRWLGAAVRRCD